jgi:predicted nucleic acid-binding protein
VKVALDTNILAYAEGVNGAEKREQALDLLQRLPDHAVIVPAQALGELFNVLVIKAKRSREVARTAVLTWRDAYAVGDTSAIVMVNAVDLSTDHQMKVWDAVMLSVAAESDCRLLLSEDLQDGFTWRGVSVTNPFGSKRHALLDALLGEAASEPPDFTEPK